MNLLEDPSMQEIVIDFCQESEKNYAEMDEILYDLEDDLSNKECLEKYGQVIDRVMGAAKTIGADKIGTICELGKIIGYKSSQVKEEALLNIVVAVLFDANEILKKMNKQLEAGKGIDLKNINTEAFVSRLKWLSEKFTHVERSSVSVEKKEEEQPVIGSGENQQSQADIDSLLADLGL
jgi:chemotaxis protein histidine kinase CheA